MPSRAPHICGCGRIVPHGALCVCQRQRKAETDKRRPNARARGYDANWRRERAVYLKNNPACKRCGNPATVVDHVTPHRGNYGLFWNRANWQPLCTHCHNAAKQSAERSKTQ